MGEGDGLEHNAYKLQDTDRRVGGRRDGERGNHKSDAFVKAAQNIGREEASIVSFTSSTPFGNNTRVSTVGRAPAKLSWSERGDMDRAQAQRMFHVGAGMWHDIADLEGYLYPYRAVVYDYNTMYWWVHYTDGD